MLNHKPRKLSLLVGIYLLISVIGFSVGLLYWTYHTATHAVDHELRISFEQRHFIAENILERQLELIGSALHKIREDESFLSEIFKSNQPETEEILSEMVDSDTENPLDILFVTLFEGSVWADASSPLFDTESVLPEIIKYRGALSSGRILRVKKGESDMTMILIASQIIRKQSGKILGTLFGGIVLNDNLSLLEIILRRTKSRAVAFVEGEKLIASTDLMEAQNTRTLIEARQNNKEGEIHFGNDLLVSYRTVSLLGEMMPMEIVTAVQDDTVTRLQDSFQKTGAVLLFFSIIYMMFTIFIITRLTFPSLKKLLNYSDEVSAGNLQAQYDSCVITEFNQIGQAMEEMVAGLREKERLKAENLRMGAELDIARRLQQMVLPAAEELEQIEGLEIAGFMEPADEISGDYYDVLIHDGSIKIGIGDVTGHGLESGVLMIMTQTVVRTLLISGEADPVRFLSILNRVIYDNVQRMNIDKTLTLSLIDYRKGKVKLSGQHEEMIVVRKGGKTERVDTIDLGFPIGLEDNISDFVSEANVSLHSGDGVVLYSDGITEAENMEGEFYGLERLCSIISHNWKKPAEGIKQAVIEDVRQFIGKQKVYDDLTLVVLKQR